MLLKPRGAYSHLEGRIDGVMYGQTQYGTVGINWPYPTSSPSWMFSTSNDTIRRLDQNWGDVPSGKKHDWELFIEELLRRELCLLWGEYFSGRSLDEAAKAGYINCNVWRNVMSHLQSDDVPTNDLLPDGDYIEVVNSNPFEFIWHRPSGTPPFRTFIAVWAQCRNSEPARTVPIRKMVFCGAVPFIMNLGMNIQPTIDAGLKKFPGCFVQLGLAAGAVGSVPFAAFQEGVTQ